VNPRRAMLGWFWLWVLVLCAAGCSGARTETAPASADAKPFQVKRDGISVSADPYFTTHRMVLLFYGGDRFAESGVLPVQLAIENAAEENQGQPARVPAGPARFSGRGADHCPGRLYTGESTNAILGAPSGHRALRHRGSKLARAEGS